MKRATLWFHRISYLQYPFLLAALLHYIPFVMALLEKKLDWAILNQVLLLLGVSLSFSTLQDTTTTQNEFSRKIWESPKKGKMMLWVLAATALIFIAIGLAALFFFNASQTDSVAVGLVVLGIGMVGMLKAAIEMFENHRLDKNPEK